MKSTAVIVESLENITLLTNESKEVKPEPMGCMDQISSCLDWICKWKVPLAVYDSDIYEVRLVDLVPDAAPANKPGNRA